MRRLVEYALLASFVLSLAVLPGYSQSRNPLMGAWKVSEVQNPNQPPLTNPQPGLYVFSEKHYSAIRIQGTKPLPAYPSNDKATAADKAQVFDSLYMNTGAYTINGNTLITMPQVAKSAFAMAPGRKTEYTFTVSGNTLTLAQKDGPTVKFVRAE
jgi:hypothetical protein